MDEKQQLAFLQAKVEILEKRVDKQDEDRKDFEKNLNEKLDLLIKDANFSKGVIKAVAVFIGLIGFAIPIAIKFLH